MHGWLLSILLAGQVGVSAQLLGHLPPAHSFARSLSVPVALRLHVASFGSSLLFAPVTSMTVSEQGLCDGVATTLGSGASTPRTLATAPETKHAASTHVAGQESALSISATTSEGSCTRLACCSPVALSCLDSDGDSTLEKVTACI